MPVIAVGVAIGASVMAGSAVAAVGLTVVTALEITAAVGATIGAIGAVTHDKALSMAGTVIGAVGAIGGLAAGAGLLGEAAASNAPLFGTAPTAGAADAAAADTVGFVTSAEGSSAASGGVEAGTWGAAADSVGAVDSAGNIVSQVAVPAGTEMAGQDAAALKASTDTASDALTLASKSEPVGQTAIVPPPDASGTPLMGPSPSTGVGPTPTPGSGLSAQANPELHTISGATQAPPSSDSTLFSSMLDFAKANPVVALGAIQAGGSMLAGMTSTLTPAQVSALNSQAAANDATSALTRQQTANLAAPKAVASSAPVTGTPAPLIPNMGMINQPRQPQVTGAPA